jgi:hypothetical protein
MAKVLGKVKVYRDSTACIVDNAAGAETKSKT